MSEQYRHSCGYRLALRSVWNGQAHVTQIIDGEIDDSEEPLWQCPGCGEAILAYLDIGNTVLPEAEWQEQEAVCKALVQKKRLERAAPALFKACEMGRSDIWCEGSILRAAATRIRNDYAENPVWSATAETLKSGLLAKADAEEAALKAARGEE